MAQQNPTKMERDIEELKKQIWLLTLKIRNLKETTSKLKRAINHSESEALSVSEDSQPVARKSRARSHLNDL